MGFGQLLVGYIVCFSLTVGLGPYAFAGMLIGGFLMYLGLSELKKYSPVFIYALVGSILIVLCSFFETAAYIDGYFSLGLNIASDNLLLIFDYIEFAVNMFFNFAMLFGIADLSRRVDYQPTREKAHGNMASVAIFNAYQILMFMPIPFLQGNNGFFLTLLAIVKVIYTVLNAYLIFKCYAMICPEGQEDMPRKRSRFAFVNRIRDMKDAQEEKAAEEMKNYFEEKLRKRNQKKSQKKNQHKRKKK